MKLDQFDAFANTKLGRLFLAYEDTGCAIGEKRNALFEEFFKLTPILQKADSVTGYVDTTNPQPKHADDF